MANERPPLPSALQELVAAVKNVIQKHKADIGTLFSSKLDKTENAVSASKLQTARTIALSGDLAGSAGFDGSGNVSIAGTVKDDSHNHTTLSNVDMLRFNSNSSDAVSIGTSVSGTITSLDFNLQDDYSDRFRWRYNYWDAPGALVDVMTLIPQTYLLVTSR